MAKNSLCNMEVACRTLLILDIFRGMVLSAVLVGIFCGMSNVDLYKLKETLIGEKKNVRVDYYGNREKMVLLMMVGIAFCCIDILMALAMDLILSKKLRKAGIVWMNCSIIGLMLRIGLYVYVGKNETELGLDRMSDITPLLKKSMRILYLAGFAYEIVKVLEIIVGTAAQMEFITSDKSEEETHVHVPSRRILVRSDD